MPLIWSVYHFGPEKYTLVLAGTLAELGTMPDLPLHLKLGSLYIRQKFVPNPNRTVVFLSDSRVSRQKVLYLYRL